MPDCIVSRRARLAIGLIVAGAVLLRFYGLGRQGFWYDEARTAWMLRGGFGHLLDGVAKTESAPPLYYVIAWPWVRVLGNTEIGLRSLSALAGAATVPFGFAAARLLVGSRAALVSALLLAVNPLLIWYAQEARAYALVVLLSTIALWLFARARSERTPRSLAVWAVAAIAAVWTHYFAVFLIAPQALLLLHPPPRRRAGLAVAAIGAGALPLLLLAERQGHHADWIRGLPLGLRAEQVAWFFVDGFTPPSGRAVAAASAVLVSGALLGFARAVRSPTAGGLRAIALIAGMSLTLPLVAAAAGMDYLDGRNVLASVVAVVIAAGAGFTARPMARAGAVMAAALAVLSVALVVALWLQPSAQRPDWPALAERLAQLPSPRVIRLEGGSLSFALPLAFHLRHTWWLPAAGALVRELDTVRRLASGRECGRTNWWGAACAIPRPRHRVAAPRGFRRAGTISVGGFAITRYRAPRPTRIVPAPGGPHRAKPRLLLTPMPEPSIG